jgi:hypothetical protein
VANVEVRQSVALRTLHGIELAAVGTWNASTGETTFTVEDFTNAVAALQCPGVRNPVIKLGHAEPDSTGGVRWDGEPAVGWVANMRFDGAKMLGDLTGVPAWLADADENGLSVLAAAYPDRSIEIWRPFVCQIGHEHPSVITALSLLGVAPPGVGVLKSMQDVYAAFTVPGQITVSAAALSAYGPGLLEKLNGGPSVITTVTLAAAAEPRGLTDIEQQSGVDFAALRTVWDSELDDLVAEWDDLSATQRADLAAQIETAVDDDNPDALGALLLAGTAGSALMVPAMLVMAQTAADDMVAAAAKQGTSLDAVVLADADLADVAAAVAAAMADGTAASAGRTAAQLLGTGDGKHVAGQVVDYLAGLTDRFLRDQLGGALSAAQHVGRHKALAQFSGDVEWYASEVNDTNACAPCHAIDGHRFGSEDEAITAYGSGKFSDCLAGARCRGQLIPILGPDRSAASAPISTTVRMTLGGPMGTKTGGVVKASVSIEDISRKYYETAGYSMWITEMQVDPLQLIAAEDATGKYYRIPVELSGDQLTFGDPQEVAVAYQDVKAVAKAAATWADRKAAFAAARKNEDGTDLVAKDVSPAGAAIRKALEAKASTATVETEVPVAETPDADSAAGPTTTPKEASVDAAKMREALGLAPEATDAEVSEAFAAQASAAVTPPNTPDPAATLTAIPPNAGGAMLIDPENYKALVAMAAKGQTAFEQMQRNERDHVLNKAVTDGRFPVSRLSTYSAMWDKDPASTKAYIELMPKNSVPVMAAGFLGAEISQNETDLAYEGVYGKVGA